MPAPCDCGRCRLCELYATRPDYRAYWERRPAARRAAPCVHLGRVLDRRGCSCPLLHLRRCERYGACTLELCARCPDYQADE